MQPLKLVPTRRRIPCLWLRPRGVTSTELPAQHPAPAHGCMRSCRQGGKKRDVCTQARAQAYARDAADAFGHTEMCVHMHAHIKEPCLGLCSRPTQECTTIHIQVSPLCICTHARTHTRTAAEISSATLQHAPRWAETQSTPSDGILLLADHLPIAAGQRPGPRVTPGWGLDMLQASSVLSKAVHTDAHTSTLAVPCSHTPMGLGAPTSAQT